MIIVSTAVQCKYNCLHRIFINSIGKIPCLRKLNMTKNFVTGHSKKFIPKILQVLRLAEVSPTKVSLFKVWYFMFHVYFFVTSSILKSYFCLNLFTGYIFCFSLFPSINARKYKIFMRKGRDSLFIYLCGIFPQAWNLIDNLIALTLNPHFGVRSSNVPNLSIC